MPLLWLHGGMMGDLYKILNRMADNQGSLKRRVADLDESEPLRHLELQDPTSIASANTLTLGQGNFFQITGAVTINNITLTGWTSGAIISLRFAAALTITHEAGGDGQISLCAGVSLTTVAGTILGLILDGTTWREIRACVAGGVGAAVGARVYNNVNLSIPDVLTTELTYNTERFDTHNMHSAGSGRFTVPYTGIYTISLSVAFAANTTGFRACLIEIVGGSVIAEENMLATTGGALSVMTITTIYRLTASNVVRSLVTQTSGGPLNVQATGGYSPEFSIALIGT